MKDEKLARLKVLDRCGEFSFVKWEMVRRGIFSGITAVFDIMQQQRLSPAGTKPRKQGACDKSLHLTLLPFSKETPKGMKPLKEKMKTNWFWCG